MITLSVLLIRRYGIALKLMQPKIYKRLNFQFDTLLIVIYLFKILQRIVKRMSKKDEESPRVSASPNPPPLPVAFISSRQERTFAARKSALRKYCCTPTATKNTWDCLFDEGYRADVSINTDNGGVLYAHASILVRSLHNLFHKKFV